MNNFLKFYLAFFIMGFIQLASAQESIVFLRNDTQESIILDELQWLQGKLVNRANNIRYLIENVAAVETNGELYEVHNVDFNLTVSKDVVNRTVNLIRDTTIYLQKIVGGDIDLFSHIDLDGNKHFFIQKNDQFFELVKEKISEGGKTVVRDKYKGILKLNLVDCDEIDILSIDKLSFSEKQFKKTIIRYNTMCGEQSYVSSSEKHGVRFGLLGGYAIQSSKFSGESKQEFTKHFLNEGTVDYNSFQLGGFFQIPIAYTRTQLSIVLQAYYSANVNLVGSEQTTRFTHTDTTNYNYILDFDMMEYGLMVNKDLFFQNSAHFMSVAAGVSFNRILSNNSNYLHTEWTRRPLFNIQNEGDLIPDFGLPNNMVVYSIRLAYNYQNMSVGSNFRFGNGGYITNNKVESFSAIALDLRYGF